LVQGLQQISIGQFRLSWLTVSHIGPILIPLLKNISEGVSGWSFNSSRKPIPSGFSWCFSLRADVTTAKKAPTTLRADWGVKCPVRMRFNLNPQPFGPKLLLKPFLFLPFFLGFQVPPFLLGLAEIFYQRWTLNSSFPKSVPVTVTVIQLGVSFSQG